MDPDPLVIRKGTAGDSAAIARIQAASPESAHWNPESYLGYDCLVAIAQSEVVAFLVSRELLPGEREILNLAVIPSYRRRGIASRLLKEELDRSSETWFLEVRESNLAALNLYKQMGFTPVGRREQYYQDPSDAAIVMRIVSCYRHDAQSAVGDRLPGE
ncbi:MAG: GNAT family N-acetyltransferase [Bryobacteraceae bacterium]|jgi:ribosomal-protein-alanine N-acetyltransferase